MSIFVTGATGFIGSHLTRALSNRNQVVALIRDRTPNHFVDKALSQCIQVKGDIRNLSLMKRIINQYEIKHVYHLAAQSIVKHAYRNPVETFQVNVMGTVNLLEACRQLDVEKILLMNTDKIYGEQTEATVECRLQPTEPYGTSKICQSMISDCFQETYCMNIVQPRSCNVYGYDWNNRIIPNTIRACLRGKKPIIFKGEHTKRQYIYVEDLTDCLLYIMFNFTGKFNIGTDAILGQEEVVKTILEFFPDLEPRYVEREAPPKEIEKSSIICSVPPSVTMEDSDVWKPDYSFKEGIEETINKFRKYWRV